MKRSLLCLGVPVSIQSKLMTRLSQRHFKKLLVDLINLLGVRLFLRTWGRCEFEVFRAAQLPSGQRAIGTK